MTSTVDAREHYVEAESYMTNLDTCEDDDRVLALLTAAVHYLAAAVPLWVSYNEGDPIPVTPLDMAVEEPIGYAPADPRAEQAAPPVGD